MRPFGLLGERVDLGAFSYTLMRAGNDWYLGERDSTSPSSRTVQVLANAASSIWHGELSSWRGRVGEVRRGVPGGAWMQGYGNRYDVGPAGGANYRQRQNGWVLGVDTKVQQADAQVVVGVLGGYSHSQLDLARGSSGTVDSYYAGVYGAWLADNGWYLDGLLKLNQLQNRADVRMSDGSRANGRYTNMGLGASLELGKTIGWTDQTFIEPFVQLTGLTTGTRTFSLDNGIHAQSQDSGSLLGKVGTTVGGAWQLAGDTLLEPYIKAAVAHELVEHNQVRVNGHRLRTNLSGTRGELAAGIAVALSSQLRLSSHIDYMKGERIEQPMGVGLGLSYAFD